MAQLVRAPADHGELGRHQGVFPGGWSYRSGTNSSIPATGYPGELGIGITVVWGCSGWRESARGRLRVGESSGGQCGEGELDSGDALLLWLRVYGGERVRKWERRCGEREVRGWLIYRVPARRPWLMPRRGVGLAWWRRWRGVDGAVAQEVHDGPSPATDRSVRRRTR